MSSEQGVPLRMTKQRCALLDVVRACTDHPTANEVYARVRRTLPRISLATVYRNLEELSERGVILRVEFAGDQRRYDGCTEAHQHVVCRVCGRVGDVWVHDDAESGRPGLAERVRSSFRLEEHRIEWTGLCPACMDGGSQS